MYDTGYEFIGWEALIEVWAPRVLGALLILVAAWFIGKAVKWALARGVDRIPGASKANLSENPKHSIGHSLGDVALWLILLFGVVAALGVLNLGQVVTPLNALLTQVASFLPNVLGAALIFFIGFVVATLARRVTEAALQAANADRWLDKAGLSRATGSTGVSTAVGTLVFVLVLIPITIAALEQLGIESLTVPAVAVLSTVFDAIPRVLAAAIVLAIGWFIGRWVAQVVERVLPATGFDRSVRGVMNLASDRSAAERPATAPYAGDVTPAMAAALGESTAPAPMTPSRVVGKLVMVAIVAFTAVEAARLLEFATLAATVEEILGLAGRVIVGGVIITAGVLIADVLARLIEKGTGGADRFASTLVRWATIALATAMGLRFMGIADDVVLLAFGLVLGAAAVAAALAFGLGGRSAAGQVAQRWADKVTGKTAARSAAAPPKG
ncbi:MAG: mechanosensitive ion channel [Brevundimonas sp.]|uniref:mechanosensitive ion channel n=1 Tax=Brevundimonas sp. TaxID=1871086 RepID=UPI002611F55C|nr:mechanosensitive ion channel [Brevundimonas sp.]MDI6623623.1 mechanosensitive ion channel [Brevundimonas sp.]MDQ7811815.1 mechanosensitive ion channel [Brevundimonas sp.]